MNAKMNTLIDKVKQKLYKLFRVYYWPFIVFILFLELGAFILLDYSKRSVIDDPTKLLFDSILMFLAAFMGILFPIFIDRNLKKEDDRRTLKFALSFLWGELRSNIHILKQIEINYRFKGMVGEIEDSLFLVNTISPKLKSMIMLDKLLRNDSYLAIQQSGNSSTIDEDGYYNDINQTYENLLLFRSAMTMTFQNVEMKKYIFTQTIDPLSDEDKEKLTQETLDQIKSCYGELLFSISRHEKTISVLESKLTKLGIKSEKVLRNVVRQEEMP